VKLGLTVSVKVKLRMSVLGKETGENIWN